MRLKFIKRFTLAFTMVLLLTGCGANVQGSDIVNKSYVYEKDGFDGDFKITINEDGTYNYCEGLFSSYIGVGEWTLEGDTLLLTDDGDIASPIENYFKVEGNDLIFQSEKSSNFIYIKVADGEKFTECLSEEGADAK